MNSKYQADPEMVQTFFDNYYHDRGKIKWQGFYLSDHTAALKKQAKKASHQNDLRPQQGLTEITKFLMQSYTYNQIVQIQLNVFDLNDHVKDDLTGEIKGYDEDLFYLDNGKKFHLSEVRNVAMVA
ncbi:hypothetical protein [Companilactobacillus futsaii]|uniref:DNA-directed RNA polymerase beta subunit n=2 Tax=Companilactobacillus futsaii TaxID=938155 RepID=A0A5B7T0B1_9LACO|nr:hypothetical protein [Companilactobacillus futsaii]KRK94124.1 hypothetical protein FC88_GL000122 [Companilactobacillus futsaii JCM 17355]QCX23974.1 hypothetical protein FG051_02130 [Companilactobacillus futsaii]